MDRTLFALSLGLAALLVAPSIGHTQSGPYITAGQ